MAYFSKSLFIVILGLTFVAAGIIRIHDRDLAHTGEDMIVVSYRGFQEQGTRT
jgi:hypothetical protein